MLGVNLKKLLTILDLILDLNIALTKYEKKDNFFQHNYPFSQFYSLNNKVHPLPLQLNLSLYNS